MAETQQPTGGAAAAGEPQTYQFSVDARDFTTSGRKRKHFKLQFIETYDEFIANLRKLFSVPEERKCIKLYFHGTNVTLVPDEYPWTLFTDVNARYHLVMATFVHPPRVNAPAPPPPPPPPPQSQPQTTAPSKTTTAAADASQPILLDDVEEPTEPNTPTSPPLPTTSLTDEIPPKTKADDNEEEEEEDKDEKEDKEYEPEDSDACLTEEEEDQEYSSPPDKKRNREDQKRELEKMAAVAEVAITKANLAEDEELLTEIPSEESDEEPRTPISKPRSPLKVPPPPSQKAKHAMAKLRAPFKQPKHIVKTDVSPELAKKRKKVEEVLPPPPPPPPPPAPAPAAPNFDAVADKEFGFDLTIADIVSKVRVNFKETAERKEICVSYAKADKLRRSADAAVAPSMQQLIYSITGLVAFANQTQFK
jgi:hypothetical protein